jgi:hypothetical protein
MATFTADLAAVDDQQQVDTSTVDTGEQGQTQDDVQQQQPNVDGRRGPMDIRSAAKSIAEALADPTNDLAAKFPGQEKAVKAITDGYFRADAYAKVFPKVEEAQAAKQLIEGVGGLDGLTQIQSRIATYDAQDEGLKSGNPEVLDAAFKDFPEGMATLAPHYLDKLAKSNPEAFEATIAPHAMGMLDRAGIPSHIAQMMQETDPARLKNMVGQLDAWIKKNSETVKTMRTAQPTNPLEGKLKEQQTALQKSQDEFFSKQVDTAMNSAAQPELVKTVDQYAKTYKLNDVQKARFGTSLATRVVQEMLADDTFKKQDQLRRNSKDVEKVSSFRATEFQRRLSDAAFKEAQELYGATQRPANGTGEVKPGGPKAAPGGGPLMVSRALDTADLDMRKDPNGYLFIANKGYRKADGAFVTWK